jgi:hypothetical protein
MRELALAGRLIKTGSTRGALSGLTSARSGVPASVSFSKSYRLTGLAEDAVFQEAARRIHLARAVAENGRDIVQYGFTEMLNNAIERNIDDLLTIAPRNRNVRCDNNVRSAPPRHRGDAEETR